MDRPVPHGVCSAYVPDYSAGSGRILLRGSFSDFFPGVGLACQEEQPGGWGNWPVHLSSHSSRGELGIGLGNIYQGHDEICNST